MTVESKKVQVGGQEINIGGNASKEEEEEKLEDEIKTVINIVDAHSLQVHSHAFAYTGRV